MEVCKRQNIGRNKVHIQFDNIEEEALKTCSFTELSKNVHFENRMKNVDSCLLYTFCGHDLDIWNKKSANYSRFLHITAV